MARVSVRPSFYSGSQEKSRELLSFLKNSSWLSHGGPFAPLARQVRILRRWVASMGLHKRIEDRMSVFLVFTTWNDEPVLMQSLTKLDLTRLGIVTALDKKHPG